jgi:biopolymer transport protein ExbD
MDLPKATDLLGQQVVLVVTLHPNGDVAVDGEKVATDDALRARVHRAVEKVGVGLRAVIQADRTVPYGQVIHVMDEMKQAGVVKFAFAVASSAP